MAPTIEVTLVSDGKQLTGQIVAVKNLGDWYGNLPNPKATVALRKNGSRVSSAVFRTRVFRQTANPQFDFNFSMPLTASDADCTLEIRIHSHDTFTSSEMGKIIVSLDGVPRKSDDPKCRRWYYINKAENQSPMFKEPSLYQNYTSANSERKMEIDTKMDDAVIRGYVRVKPRGKGIIFKNLAVLVQQWPFSYVSVTPRHLKLYEVDMDNKTEATLMSVHSIRDVRNVKSDEGTSRFSVEIAGSNNDDNFRIHMSAFRAGDTKDWMNAIHDIVAEYGQGKDDSDDDTTDMTAVGTVVQLPAALQLAPQFENTSIKFITYRCSDQEYVLSDNNLELDDWKEIRVPMYLSQGGPLVVYLEDGQIREIPAADLAKNNEASLKMGGTRDLLVEWSVGSVNTDKKGKLRAACWMAVLFVGLLTLEVPHTLDVRFVFFLLAILTVIKSILTVMESTTKELIITNMTVKDKLESDDLPVNGPMLMMQDSTRIEKTGWGRWSNATHDHLKLRGPNYLADRVKIAAGNHMFRCVELEISNVPEKVVNASANSILVDKWRVDHPAIEVEGASDEDIIKNMIFVTSWQIPAAPWFCMVNYFVFDQQQAGSDLFPVFCRTVKRFVDATDKERKKKFKLIPRVIEGPWVVKSAVGSTPAILGKKLKTTYYYDKARNVFEVEVDVSSSTAAGQILKLVKGATKTLVMDLNILIESQNEDELPEVLLGGARLYRPDLSKLPDGRPT